MKSFNKKVVLGVFFSLFSLFAINSMKIVDELASFRSQIDTFVDQRKPFFRNNDNWHIKPDVLAVIQRPRPQWLDFNSRVALQVPQAFWPNDFFPYAEKFILPEDAIINIFGDLHANYAVLMKMKDELIQEDVLNRDLDILKTNHYFVFLGDYIDRGINDLEVIDFLLKLSNKNPGKVFVMRGNHDVFPEIPFRLNLFEQLKGKKSKIPFGAFESLVQVGIFFESLPIVFYLGRRADDGTVNYVQFSHGLLDHGYNPKEFLAGDKRFQAICILRRACLDFKLFEENTQAQQRATLQGDIIVVQGNNLVMSQKISGLGFLWSDIEPVEYERIDFDKIRGAFRYGKMAVHSLLSAYDTPGRSRVTGIVRGHQHGEDKFSVELIMGDGAVVTMCQDRPVWTIISSHVLFNPNDSLRNCSFARLHLNSRFNEWKMEVISSCFDSNFSKNITGYCSR